MKILITLFICCLCGILYSQGGGGGTFPDNELNIQIQSAPNRTITFELIPLGANWANTTGCNFNMYNDETTYISSLTAGSNGYVDCYQNGYEYHFFNEGNHTHIIGCAQSTAGLKPFRNGIYRINIKENGQLKTYAYFDWRDTGFTVNVCRSCSGHNDMTIRYDGQNEELWFWKDNTIDFPNQNPDQILAVGQIITWAELNCTPRSTSFFEDFWENALVMINNGNNNPRMVWGPFPDDNLIVSYYKVYKRKGTPNFVQIGTTTLYQFTDYDEILLEGSHESNETVAEYEVTAFGILGMNPEFESGPTNVVNARIEGEPQSKISINEQHNKKLLHTFTLNQNYPNPFNPSTIITFSNLEKSFVSLVILDVLGKEVVKLVHGIKDPGNYKVQWNAADLPSGIYFYQLQSENFTETKKMILLR